MRELLGLSLTASTVACTLVDRRDGTIVAEDVVEADSAQNVAIAADTVESLALRTERNIDAVRIAWSEGTAGSAVKLNAKLRSLGFRDVDVISEDEARRSRNRTARYIDPPLELAYGAARTVTAEGHSRPLLRMPARRVSRAAASGVVVLAVGAAAAGVPVGGQGAVAGSRTTDPTVASAQPRNDALLAAAARCGTPTGSAPEAPPRLSCSRFRRSTRRRPLVTEESEVAAYRRRRSARHRAHAGQAATMAREPLLAAEAPAAEPAAIPEIVPLPDTAAGPVAGPAAASAGQPHLTPEALSARLLPGPVPPMPVAGVPAPPAAPPPAANPYDILSALP